VDKIKFKFLIANICLKNSKLGVIIVDLLCLCYFMILRKSKQNAQKSKIVVGLVLKWLPVGFGKSSHFFIFQNKSNLFDTL